MQTEPVAQRHDDLIAPISRRCEPLSAPISLK
jgi:hypothetical protein